MLDNSDKTTQPRWMEVVYHIRIYTLTGKKKIHTQILSEDKISRLQDPS